MFVFAAMCVFVTRAPAQSSPAPMSGVQEGVYFLDGMFQTTILELKDGKFRYWFSSDFRFAGQPSYPQSGKYSTNGATVQFVTLMASNIWQSGARRITNATGQIQDTVGFGGWDGTTNGTLHTNVLWTTNAWTFFRYKGQTTVWRSHAVKSWENKRELDGYGIYFATDRKPEEIWERFH